MAKKEHKLVIFMDPSMVQLRDQLIMDLRGVVSYDWTNINDGSAHPFVIIFKDDSVERLSSLGAYSASTNKYPFENGTHLSTKSSDNAETTVTVLDARTWGRSEVEALCDVIFLLMAKKPRKHVKVFTAGGHKVEFGAKSIQVGCTKVENEKVLEIADEVRRRQEES